MFCLCNIAHFSALNFGPVEQLCSDRLASEAVRSAVGGSSSPQARADDARPNSYFWVIGSRCNALIDSCMYNCGNTLSRATPGEINVLGATHAT